MEFIKYPSLANSYKLSRQAIAMKDMEWYATEKIHGSNVSIVLDDHLNVKVAKRTSFLNDQDKPFFRMNQFVEDNPRLVNQLAYFLDAVGAKQVNAYGEFFGFKVQPLQYDITKEKLTSFRMFNIIAVFEDKKVVYPRTELGDYIDDEYLVPITKEGTLHELLKEELPVDSIYGGVSEGQVYQPAFSYVLTDKSQFVGIKRKTKEFTEVAHHPVPKEPKEKDSVEFLELIEDIARYVTKNRMINVLSHGEFELENENIGKMMIAFKEDAVKEYMRDVEPIQSETVVLSAINRSNREIAMIIKELINEKAQEVIDSLED